MSLLPKPFAETSALVLKTWACGETSVIASLLTNDYGFVKVIAKAARRPKSRLRALVEPGRLITAEFSLDKERDLQYLRGGSVELDPLQEQPTLEKSAFLLAALELLDRCRPLDSTQVDSDPDDLFDICELYVRVLSSHSGVDPALLFFAFEWELLARYGTAPELENCTLCGGKCDSDGSQLVWFSPSEGGVVCVSCAAGNPSQGAKPLGAEALTKLLSIAQRGICLENEKPLPRYLRRELGAALHRFMGYHLPGYRLPVALDLLRPVGGHSSTKE